MRILRDSVQLRLACCLPASEPLHTDHREGGFAWRGLQRWLAGGSLLPVWSPVEAHS